MPEVTVSPKYQIVIPKEIRAALRIKPGQKLSISTEDRSISLRPSMTLEELQEIGARFEAPPFVRDKSDRPFPDQPSGKRPRR